MARKPAPPISVIDPFVDERSAVIKHYSAQHPGWVLSWQSATVGSERMSRLGQEPVLDENGKPVTYGVGGDILVKTPEELFRARREVEAKRSYSIVSQMYVDKDALSKEVKARKPKRSDGAKEEEE